MPRFNVRRRVTLMSSCANRLKFLAFPEKKPLPRPCKVKLALLGTRSLMSFLQSVDVLPRNAHPIDGRAYRQSRRAYGGIAVLSALVLQEHRRRNVPIILASPLQSVTSSRKGHGVAERVFIEHPVLRQIAIRADGEGLQIVNREGREALRNSA